MALPGCVEHPPSSSAASLRTTTRGDAGSHQIALHRDVLEHAGLFTTTCPQCGLRDGRGLQTHTLWDTRAIHGAWLILLGVACLRMVVLPPLQFPDGWPVAPLALAHALGLGRMGCLLALGLALLVIPLLPRVHTPLNLCNQCPVRTRLLLFITTTGVLCTVLSAGWLTTSWGRWLLVPSLLCAAARHAWLRGGALRVIRRERNAVVVSGPACFSRILRREDPHAEWTGDVSRPC